MGTLIVYNSERNKLTSEKVFNKTMWLSLSRITVTPDGILWIYNISRADEGKYTCFAENYLGKANSTGHLSVRGNIKVALLVGTSNWHQCKHLHSLCKPNHFCNVHSIVWGIQCIWQHTWFSQTDATKITLAPSNADINQGENVTLQCHASHDTSMDLTFTWALNGVLLDLEEPNGHYRRMEGVRMCFY